MLIFRKRLLRWPALVILGLITEKTYRAHMHPSGHEVNPGREQQRTRASWGALLLPRQIYPVLGKKFSPESGSLPPPLIGSVLEHGMAQPTPYITH